MFRSVFRSLGSRRAASPRPSRRRTTPLQFEALEDRRMLAVLDLSFAFAEATANNAIFKQFTLGAAGSGNIDAFLNIQANGTEQGYNSDFRPVEFNENNSANLNESIRLSDVPLVTIDGVDYREFVFDFSQTNANGGQISLDRLEFYLDDVGNNTGFPNIGTLAYSLDAGGDNWIRLDRDVSGSGGGSLDMVALIPDSLFVLPGESDPFVYLFTRLGDNIATNDGPEEWAVAEGRSLLSDIRGYKFLDVDGSGTDESEPRLAGVTIELYRDDGDGTFDAGDTLVDTDITNANGVYRFGGLVPALYFVREIAPAGTTQTTCDADIELEASMTYVAPALGTGADDEEEVDGLAFGNQGQGSIHGLKFLDVDGDGPSMGDPGLAGWTIQLLQNGQVFAETTTMADDPNTMEDETGMYWFSGLLFGDYVVQEVVQPGWEQTFPGGDGTYDVTLDVDSSSSVGNDFGNRGIGSIHGRKFLDIDGDGPNQGDPGLAGWTIQLFQGDLLIDETTTMDDDPNTEQDETGRYWFMNLTPGDYTVVEVLQAGWEQTFPTGDGDYDITLDEPNEFFSEGNNFANRGIGSIHGAKFLAVDGGEGGFPIPGAGLAGWTIQLLQDEQVIAETVTMADDPNTPEDETGSYWFMHLPPGEYVVQEVVQAGWIQVFPFGDGTYTVTLEEANEFTSNFNHFFNVPLFAPDNSIVVSGDAGANTPPTVLVVDKVTGEEVLKFQPYQNSYRAGVRIALGDMTGDGIPEIITAPGRTPVPGVDPAPEVRVFDFFTGQEHKQFRTVPYGMAFDGGLQIAVGDVNGDGLNDLVTVPTRGVTVAKVFLNQFNPEDKTADAIKNAPYRSWQVFASNFIGGATVAVGDLGTYKKGEQLSEAPDGKGEVFVGSGSGMRATVHVYDASANSPKIIQTITPFGKKFRGGVFMDTADFTGDGLADLVVGAGNGGKSKVEIWDVAQKARLARFAAFDDDASLNAPVRVAARDTNGDNIADQVWAVQGTDGETGEIRCFNLEGVLELALDLHDNDLHDEYFVA